MLRSLSVCVALLAGNLLPSPANAEDRTSAALASRLFPTLSPQQTTALPPGAKALLAGRARQFAACGQQADCALEALTWTTEQIRTMSTSLASHAPSGAVERELRGLNAILAVYGRGEPPRYPAIDGPIGAAGSERLAQDVLVALQMSQVDHDAGYTALDPSIALAIALLDVNDRLDAIHFEPINAGLNAAAFARAPRLNWKQHPYTAIIVLGQGPDEVSTPLSAASKLRLKAAARYFAQAQAPYIIVSGGAVHPRDTHSVEAEQMRKALIERFGIPEEALILEPYARHTTTNLRNAARLLAALHAPAGQAALVVSSPSHIDTLASPRFEERNRDELGYQPGRVGTRVSAYAINFVPAPESLRVDPADPRDP